MKLRVVVEDREEGRTDIVGEVTWSAEDDLAVEAVVQCEGDRARTAAAALAAISVAATEKVGETASRAAMEEYARAADARAAAA